MAVVHDNRSASITNLLNGTFTSLKRVIPIPHEMTKPASGGSALQLRYGVLIGITGDVKGKLILAGDATIFGAIGNVMFGMALEGEMLNSFSGELGNMIAGGLATAIGENGVQIDITAPTLITGDVTLSGYEQSLKISADFTEIGKIDIYLLLD